MKFLKLDEIDSTNNYMKKNIDKFSSYDIVSAKNQTSGRGRRGNTWVSSKGMALFSFLLKTDKKLDINEYTKLPLIAGIATLSAMKKIEENDYKYKWTNDIYLEEKKLSGILVEKVENDFVIGIGINVNNQIPEEIKDIAVSLKNKHDIDKVILTVVETFADYYNKFSSGKWLDILDEINKYNFLKNKKIKVNVGSEVYKGEALDINKDGRLAVKINNEIKYFNAGEIRIEKGFI
ncbi:biotin--[acetyl-CoA-carboxylase] ligase [Fusobacterium gastrosuis]|uniref:biotin--[acetyl-CoA-carboxylase] ligase n=1 Tax=Fusobacterium gastrosuis TaxID=1755100 RepID=UPI002977184B|nr:biotin--[acetyl-CoA-carboxylase] ligase [Fusobacteriaceae bacterium]MDY5712419.1 biotin--[acetyl-CoA-carboxylase] ligase [Fusobacterium gastrosuis]